MYYVVVIADHSSHASLVADTIHRENRLQLLTAATDRGFPAALSHVADETLSRCDVLVYIPADVVEEPLWAGVRSAIRRPVILFDLNGRVDVLTALLIGVQGYVGSDEPEALTERILDAAQGNLAVPPGSAARLRKGLRILMRADRRIKSLTEVEIRMVRLLASGLTMKEIAHQCEISERGMYNRFDRLREKLKVGTTREALTLLAEAGLLAPEDEEKAAGGDTRHL